MRTRLGSWFDYHGTDEGELHDFRLLGEALPLRKPNDVTDLIGQIEEEFPYQQLGLIVLDTQARCTEGLDENSAKEMGTAIANLDKLRRTTGATVLLVHHTGYDESHARGSTAVRASLDTAIYLHGPKTSFALTCRKQKDADEFPDIGIGLLEVGESLVVVPDSPDSPERLSLARDSLAGNQRTVLEALEAHPAGLKAKDWHEASGLPRSSFYEARGSLMKKGLVEHEGDVYNFSARRSNESNPVQSKSNDVGQVEVQESNPPLGGGPLDQEAEEEDGGTGESDEEDDDLPPDTSTP